jgi:exopolyphosphatase / guanosine-5'-triphosphate,3'-diphosphate pyrophosphatase
MRLATIDLGSNTVHLLVADVSAGTPAWLTIERDQRVTRLGEGLAATGRLGEAPAARTAAAVGEYVARAVAARAHRILIVATSAVREAANGAEFAGALQKATGQPVRVISGVEEARLTLRGVMRGLGEGSGTFVTFDIGGGSTEYVLAREGRVAASVSLRLGVVPLAERFPFPDGVEWERYATLSAEVRAQLAAEVPALIREAGVRLVGTAGTVTALAALDLGLTVYDPERVHGHRLRREAVERWRRRLGALTVAERGELPCLEPGRADLIVPGTAIVLETMACLGADELTVSEYGLREGVLVDALDAAERGE